MPFLWAKVLIFQGSAHQNSVGSLSYIFIRTIVRHGHSIMNPIINGKKIMKMVCVKNSTYQNEICYWLLKMYYKECDRYLISKDELLAGIIVK